MFTKICVLCLLDVTRNILKCFKLLVYWNSLYLIVLIKPLGTPQPQDTCLVAQCEEIVGGGWVVLTFECRSRTIWRSGFIQSHWKAVWRLTYVQDCTLFHYEHAFCLFIRCDFAVLCMSHVATVVALTLDSDIYTPKMCARRIWVEYIYITENVQTDIIQ